MMADKKQVTRLLKTARGQIDGILKMVEEDRYCIDISHQIMASEAILKRANKEVLKAHMTHCVHDAVNSEDCDQKIEEMIKVLEGLKLNKSTLFVVNELTDELILASRNLEGVKVILPNEVNVLDVARYQSLVATVDAIKSIEEVLS